MKEVIDWEKKFTRKFGSHWIDFYGKFKDTETFEKIKDFITQALKSQKEDIIKRVEGKKVDHEKHKDDKSWCKYCGFNQALEEILKSLDKDL